MHEISLVKNIFKTLEEAFPGQLGNIRTISMRVGLLSNAQPILMQNAFAAVKQNEHDCRASLCIEVLPIIIYCVNCKKNTEVHNFKFFCSCGRPSRNIVQGEELLISRVEFFDSDMTRVRKQEDA